MKILEYVGLDTMRVSAQYRRATEAIARDDFGAVEVKKLDNLGHGKFYRAKLDYTNRLLFCLVRHDDQVCALMAAALALFTPDECSNYVRHCGYRLTTSQAKTL